MNINTRLNQNPLFYYLLIIGYNVVQVGFPVQNRSDKNLLKLVIKNRNIEMKNKNKVHLFLGNDIAIV